VSLHLTSTYYICDIIVVGFLFLALNRQSPFAIYSLKYSPQLAFFFLHPQAHHTQSGNEVIKGQSGDENS